MLGLHQTGRISQFSILTFKDLFSKLVPKKLRKTWIKFTNVAFICCAFTTFIILLLILNQRNIIQFDQLFPFTNSSNTNTNSNSNTLQEAANPNNNNNIGNNQNKNKNQNENAHPTIYISVATLGDFGCPQTVNSAFSRAVHPESIYMGIYQQNDDKDPDCLSTIEQQCDAITNDQESEAEAKTETGTGTDTETDSTFDYALLCQMLSTKHISINRTTIIAGAKGPVYGRYMSLKQYQNQDFIMIIDSHSVFRPNWDQELLAMYDSINNDYAVITHYPWGAEHMEQRFHDQNPDNFHSYHLCGTVIEGAPNYIPRNANGCFVRGLKKPILVPFFAGGFSFAKSHFTMNVPWDPYLLHIFNGEEFDIATRGWTAGYDFYSPTFDIIGHWYDKGPRRKSPHLHRYIPDAQKLRLMSEKRLLYMWGVIDENEAKELDAKGLIQLQDIEKYNLGGKRSIEDYWKFVGVDLKNRTITVFPTDLWAEGGLTYVPWNT